MLSSSLRRRRGLLQARLELLGGDLGAAGPPLAWFLDALATATARVGWQDKTHFIRQFRKARGQTPAAYRKAQRGGHVPDVRP